MLKCLQNSLVCALTLMLFGVFSSKTASAALQLRVNDTLFDDQGSGDTNSTLGILRVNRTIGTLRIDVTARPGIDIGTTHLDVVVIGLGSGQIRIEMTNTHADLGASPGLADLQLQYGGSSVGTATIESRVDLTNAPFGSSPIALTTSALPPGSSGGVLTTEFSHIGLAAFSMTSLVNVAITSGQTYRNNIVSSVLREEPTNVVPEPSSLLITAIGLPVVMLAARRRGRRQKV